VARGILSQSAHACVIGCEEVETSHHLFFSCSIFRDLWHSNHDWIGVFGAVLYNIVDYFLQFTYLVGGSKTRRLFIQLIWLLCVWVMWNECNNRLFSNKENNIHQLLDRVKFHSYWWLKAANVVFVLGVHSWLACPLACLGIG